MRRNTLTYSLLALLLLLISTGYTYYTQRYSKEFPLTKERELKVTLNAGFGTINIARGQASKLFEANVETDNKGGIEDYLDYAVRDGVGYMNIDINDHHDKSSGEKGSIKLDGFQSNEWTMHFTDKVPISFDVELGLGKGDLDLTGLRVKDLNLSAGASSVSLRFDTPNSSTIENLTIESGLSKFYAEGLCNANFNRMKFEGGVGTYTLDFSGDLRKEVDVDIEVGLGAMTIIIPEKVGARVIYDKSWVSHLAIDNEFTEEEEDNYFTSNYHNASGKMNFRIEAGFGSVKIKRQ